MDLRPLIPLVALGLGAVALYGLVCLGRWMERKGWIDLSHERVRRGTGHALLGAQEFLEPSIEHVFAAENLEHQEDEDHIGDDEPDRETILADLSASLRF